MTRLEKAINEFDRLYDIYDKRKYKDDGERFDSLFNLGVGFCSGLKFFLTSKDYDYMCYYMCKKIGDK